MEIQLNGTGCSILHKIIALIGEPSTLLFLSQSKVDWVVKFWNISEGWRYGLWFKDKRMAVSINEQVDSYISSSFTLSARSRFPKSRHQLWNYAYYRRGPQ